MEDHHGVPPSPPMPPAVPHGVDRVMHDMRGMHLNAMGSPYETHFPPHETQRPHHGQGRPVEPIGDPEIYEGYTFKKVESKKETWAVVTRTAMPIAQNELRAQVKRLSKKGGGGTSFQHPDLDGYKRRQVERLCEERTDSDPNSRSLHYVVACIKLNKRQTHRRTVETASMFVIIRRELRQGVVQGFSTAVGGIPLPAAQVIDLTNQDESEKSSQSGSGYVQHQHPHPRVHGGHPGVSIIYDQFQPHHGPPHGLEQPDPHYHHRAHFHDGHHAGHGHGDEEHDKHKKKDKKGKSPKIIHLSGPGEHREPEEDDSDSSTLSSSGASGYTPATPTSTFSSDDEHDRRKEKAHPKEHRRHKSGSKDHNKHEHHTTYREHKRKEPKERGRSPAPSHKSRSPATSHSRGSRYSHPEVIVQPEVSHGHRYEPRRQFGSYQRTRPVYDDDEDHDLGGGLVRRPTTVYRKRITSHPHAVDLYDERVMRLDETVERLERLETQNRTRAAIEREREVAARERRERERERELAEEEDLKYRNQLVRDRLERERERERERYADLRYTEPRYAEPRYPEPRPRRYERDPPGRYPRGDAYYL